MAPRAMRRKNLLDQFNFMVAGASRLGKSAFLRTFLHTLTVSAPSSDEPLPTPQSFDVGPTTHINQVSMIVDEAHERFGLTMVDTPGFVDDGTVDEQCRLLLTFLENQFDARLIEESRVKRNPKALHRQLHACLYFLDPSHAGLRPVDISVIRNLCERVNVIPVIAKADTLTAERMRRVRRAIRADIRTHRLRIYEFPESDDEDEEISDEESEEAASLRLPASALRRLIPFAVMSMEEDAIEYGDGEIADDVDLFPEEESEEEAEESEEEDNDYNNDDDETPLNEQTNTTTTTNNNTQNDTASNAETTTSVADSNNGASTNPTDTRKSSDTGNTNDDADDDADATAVASPQIEGNGHATPRESASNDAKQTTEKSEVFLGRRYPWGDVLVMNPTHCDVAILRTFLLETQRRLLRDTTVEVLYERYRTERMRERRATMLAARRDARSSSLPTSPVSPLLGLTI